MGGRPAIPAIPDDHLNAPAWGSWAYPDYGRPMDRHRWLAGWDDQHTRAEEQTDRMAPDRDWIPVADLYTDDRSLTVANGWCVDA